MPMDLSTAVLIDKDGAHKESTAVLRMFPHLKFPYNVLGKAGLWVPRPIRDFCYNQFAKNRGTIWKYVKKVTGMGDTQLDNYRDFIVGLEEPLDPKWGFNSKKDD